MYIYLTFTDDNNVNVGILIGAVSGGLIVAVVLVAILLKLILMARKNNKLVKKPILMTQNSEASLR